MEPTASLTVLKKRFRRIESVSLTVPVNALDGGVSGAVWPLRIPARPRTAAGARLAGQPWENGYCESFNGKLRDQLLNGEIFYTLKQAQVVIERWRCYYNTIRPHSALGYRPPVPETTPPEKVLTTMNQAA